MIATVFGLTAKADEAAKEPDLETARRDFGELKAVTTRSIALQKLAEPEFQAPRLPVTAPVLPIFESAPSIKLEEKSGQHPDARSRNWLVDAMRNEKSRTTDDRTVDARVDRRKRLDRSTADESVLDSAPGEGMPALEEADPSLKQTTEKPSLAIEGANPLERYLSSWMTAGDYALLKLASSADLANPAGYSGSLVAPGQGEAGLGQLESGFLSSDTAAPVVASTTENPYLKAMVESPAVAASSLVLPGPAVPLPAPATSEPKSPSEPKDAAAEFQKARDDAKYFKQLKRF